MAIPSAILAITSAKKATTTTVVHHLAQYNPKLWQYHQSHNKYGNNICQYIQNNRLQHQYGGNNITTTIYKIGYNTYQWYNIYHRIRQHGNNICHKQNQVAQIIGNMAITSAINKAKLPKIIGNNICQNKFKNIRVCKIAGLTNSVTPFCVGNA